MYILHMHAWAIQSCMNNDNNLLFSLTAYYYVSNTLFDTTYYIGLIAFSVYNFGGLLLLDNIIHY